MDGKQTTTFPKAKLAEIKKRGGLEIAKDLMTDILCRSDNFESKHLAALTAIYRINNMGTRRLYSFLKDNGYTFDTERARWFAPEATR